MRNPLLLPLTTTARSMRTPCHSNAAANTNTAAALLRKAQRTPTHRPRSARGNGTTVCWCYTVYDAHQSAVLDRAGRPRDCRWKWEMRGAQRARRSRRAGRAVTRSTAPLSFVCYGVVVISSALIPAGRVTSHPPLYPLALQLCYSELSGGRRVVARVGCAVAASSSPALLFFCYGAGIRLIRRPRTTVCVGRAGGQGKGCAGRGRAHSAAQECASWVGRAMAGDRWICAESSARPTTEYGVQW